SRSPRGAPTRRAHGTPHARPRRRRRSDPRRLAAPARARAEPGAEVPRDRAGGVADDPRGLELYPARGDRVRRRADLPRPSRARRRLASLERRLRVHALRPGREAALSPRAGARLPLAAASLG